MRGRRWIIRRSTVGVAPLFRRQPAHHTYARPQARIAPAPSHRTQKHSPATWLSRCAWTGRAGGSRLLGGCPQGTSPRFNPRPLGRLSVWAGLEYRLASIGPQRGRRSTRTSPGDYPTIPRQVRSGIPRSLIRLPVLPGCHTELYRKGRGGPEAINPLCSLALAPPKAPFRSLCPGASSLPQAYSIASLAQNRLGSPAILNPASRSARAYGVLGGAPGSRQKP